MAGSRAEDMLVGRGVRVVRTPVRMRVEVLRRWVVERMAEVPGGDISEWVGGC